MKYKRNIWFNGTLASLLFSLSSISPSPSQVNSDSTLSSNTSIKLEGNTQIIEGGTRAGSNLFHSFELFSVPTGSTAYFNNSLDVQNIISRVTGKSISNIDGLIRANGSSNIFFINPNGIIFGENARLEIGGSFLASTANAIKFANNLEFNATNPQAISPTPLLTISVPIGLQFERNNGAIQIRGQGHQLIGPPFSPLILSNNKTGLQVQPGKSLAIVGGNVFLEGGIITAPGGQLELGSVSDGFVSISPTTSSWIMGYKDVSFFKDISLSERALADVSGTGSGSMQIQGRRITLIDGSLFLNQNQGLLAAGSISVNASEYLEVSGSDPVARTAGGLRNETLGFGRAGDIAVSTKQLIIRNGGQLNSLTFGAAPSGNVVIDASNSVQLIGVSPFNPGVFSTISAATFNSGNTGDIRVSTGRFVAIDGGNLSSSTFGTGRGGDVTLSATDLVEIIGASPITSQPSILSSTSLNAGKAGTLTVNTSKLIVDEGGRVDASTFANGEGGSVIVNANLVELIGTISGSSEPSLINASASIAIPTLQKLFRLPSVPSGKSGEVTVNTNQLNITDGALISVRNDGPGNAGTLQINADRISITNAGGITATTAIGEGGDISIKSKLIQLRSGIISATAGTIGTSGNGGNIRIVADILTAIGNSAITANAFEGRGGNIRIDTKGFFVSPDTQITASSERGIDGTVKINFQERNPSQSEAQPEAIAQTPEIVSVCQASSKAESSFVNFGIQGLADSSDGQIDDNSIWERNFSPVQAIDNSEQSSSLVKQGPTRIVEAQGWVVNANGDIVLIAQTDAPSPYTSASSTCDGQPSMAQASSLTETARKK
ncbi:MULTISPECIES: filamentous hemagglutinin N-terminal domain-containing protein [Nostoc]|uniref:Filamentous hemagglutinin N-terminal domain-containing protein n=1 Tax=Nostoc paludosum FACHB-159 TaxID=2692908 RepID=A0ABR8KLQ4_9NOSO|nr:MULTISPECIES: filamentous hemagglutinin N-terminal domain-containing protein [Nostoc]MBD2683212.1 filamentous hemagglutinin N-terminal domain-containing protein [Nostoc sp. FACHB-857]MBD2739539.1 filamentous hemagglutinin N-terminal domain-containing protein [Nostoc paludosum FACHB-159]